MKKVFRLEELDCASCAQKMEDGIKKIKGVQDCTVSFMSQKMTLTADDERFDSIVKEAVKLCRKIEPDCVVVIK